MTCTACGEQSKNAADFTKAVIEINNPETLVLLRKVVIPATMGGEDTFPPVVGKYRNVLLHYEASGSNFLYSSDGIPTQLSAAVPKEVYDRIEDLEDGLAQEVLDRKDADLALSGDITTLDNSLATVAKTGSYTDLTNKPTIGDGTLTIEKNSTSVGTFKANATSDTTIDISVPTKTSELANDGSDNTSTYVELDELATVATSGSYNDLLNKPTIPTIPTKTSSFINDGADGTSVYVEADELATVATTGSYGDLLNKPTVDSSLSEASTNAIQNKAVSTALDNSVMTGLSVNANPSTTTVQLDGSNKNLYSGATTTANIPLPVASSTQAGVMNSATYDAVTSNTTNINAILNGAVAITGISATPSQSDLTTAWQTETGLTTLINRASIYDVTNEKVWTYYTNDTTWHAASNTSQVTINTFTNSSEGTILGSTNVGQIFAENDGTGSVNGWDTLSSAVSTNTGNITSLQTAVAGKQNTLTAGSNIDITSNVISATDTTYTAGNAINISASNEISADIYPADFFMANGTVIGEGTNFTMNNTVEATIKDIKLKGDTDQQIDPEPDTPQSVKVVAGAQTVSISGKNLFNENYVLEDAYFDDTAEQPVITSGGDNNVVVYIPCKPSTTYSLRVPYASANPPLGVIEIGYTEAKPAIGVNVYNASRVRNPGGEVYTYNGYQTGAAAEYIVLRFQGNSFMTTGGGWDLVKSSFQIEEGATATAYEPSKTVSYQITLGSIELCKVGDYQDYIYKDSGGWHLHKEVGKVVLTGAETEPWKESGSYSCVHNILLSDILPATSNNDPYTFGLISDHFTVCSQGYTYYTQATYNGQMTVTNDSYLSFNYSQTASIASWRTWLSSNNVTAYYPLASAVNTTITDSTLVSQLNALSFAYSHDSKTNVIVEFSNPNLPVIIRLEADRDSKAGLVEYISTKQDKLTAGNNITISGDTISATDTTYSAGTGIDLTGTTFSVDTTVVAMQTDIPTVNDSTLTIQNNGTDVATFTANSSTDVTANIVPPVQIGSVLSTPTNVAYVNANNIVDGAVTTAKIAQYAANNAILTAKNIQPASDTPGAWLDALGGPYGAGEGGYWVTYYNEANTFTNQPSQYGWLETISEGPRNIYQRWTLHGTGPVMYRLGNVTGWWNSSTNPGDFKSLNGDYTTTEEDTGRRWIDGKTIYKKTVDVGQLPSAAGAKTVAHSISNFGKVIRMEGVAINTSNTTSYMLPYSDKDGATYSIGVTANSTNVSVSVGRDRSALDECYVTIYYTKSS